MFVNMVPVNIAFVSFVFEVRFPIQVGYFKGFLELAGHVSNIIISIESCWFKFCQDIIWKSVKPYDDQFIMICFGSTSLVLGLLLSSYKFMTSGLKVFCHGVVEQHVWFQNWHYLYTDEVRYVFSASFR